MLNYYQSLLSKPSGSALIVVLAIWSLFWKGKALWRAAKNSQMYWFVAILILNTVGILEIVYLLFFQKKATPQKNLAKAEK